MPDFYRQAYEAACRGNLPRELPDTQFDDWASVEEALRWLHRDEQRCDAIYGNWLMRLNNPGGSEQWKAREHLTRGGGLDANYLAELAQNANDAADGQDAELRVTTEQDWLVVANNGRKITPLNLIGLCDFFGHFELPLPGVRSIGKFGVGFKASFGIADEIFVHTWGGNSSFTFRIPITAEDRPASHPDPRTLERVTQQLSSVGVRIRPDRTSLKFAGYCTPEFVEQVPPVLEAAIRSLATTPQGTIFGYHLHEAGVAEVNRRVSTQSENIYELCPLFVPCLRSIQLGANRMTLVLGQDGSAPSPTGELKIAKATLSVSSSQGRQSHVRFWRLTGSGADDRWQLALHTDKGFRLHVRRSDEEEVTSVREGAAYAFFPLHAVTWPLKLHLHIDLPTAVSRGDWAHGKLAETDAVENQIARAVRATCGWLAENRDRWHDEWRLDQLFDRTPRPDEEWAHCFWKHTCAAVQSIPLLPCLWGGTTTSKCHSLRIVNWDRARAYWRDLGEALPDLCDRWPLTESAQHVSFGDIPVADPEEVFEQIFPRVLDSAPLRRAFVAAFLSCDSLTMGVQQRILADIPVERASGTTTTFRELFEQPSGAELSPEWHEVFRLIHSWADQANWRNNRIFGPLVRDKLRQLSEPQVFIGWDELSIRMAGDDAWNASGASFWSTPRSPCPVAEREKAIQSIRLPGGLQKWEALSEAWVEDESSASCFAGLVAEWPLHDGTERKRIRGLLNSWGLLETWETVIRARLTERLKDEFFRLLAANATKDALVAVFGPAFTGARDAHGAEWKQLVQDAQRQAVARFIKRQTEDLRLADKIVLSSSIGGRVRGALCLLDTCTPAPAWLTDLGYTMICRMGLQPELAFTYETRENMRGERQTDFCRRLLGAFYLWKSKTFGNEVVEGLEELFRTEGLHDRQNFAIRLSTQRVRAVREFLVVSGNETSGRAPDARLMQKRLALAAAQVEPLPAPLHLVNALASAAANPNGLHCERNPGSEVLIDRTQVQAIIDADPDVKDLVDSGLPLYGASRGLTLTWRSGETLVAQLMDADVGHFGDRLVFGKFARPATEEQYERLLSLYELSDVNDEYRGVKERGATPFELYAQFRNHIVDVLVKKHVKEVGYSKEDVLRELIQNAESAYASKRDAVSQAWFEFRVGAGPNPGERRIFARHAGRAFNERDRDDKERRDTERIIKITAPNQNTENELGRFNRGFKTVFTVAKDGKVGIRSGRLKFEIQDLLLLNPPAPSPSHPLQFGTEFDFVTSNTDAATMLQLRGDPRRATPAVLNATSFVFLTQLRQVKLIWDDRAWEWRVGWTQLGPGWVRINVAETTTGESEAFSVHSGRLPDKRRFAIAVRLGSDGEPQNLESNWKNLRLTFATDREFGFDVLVNGDFEADQGRVNVQGLAGRGADLVDAALSAGLDRAAEQISSAYSKKRWVAWAKVLHLSDAEKIFEMFSPNATSRFESWLERLEQVFGAATPCRRGPLSLAEARFPSRLMRRLAKDFGSVWGINSQDWIEPDAEEQLPAKIREERTKIRFPAWISNQPVYARVLRQIQGELTQTAFAALKRTLSKPEKDELAEAERVLEDKLRVFVMPEEPPREVELPPIQEWTVGQLWGWWEQEKTPLDDYTLEGTSNWPLLYATDPGEPVLRRERLKYDLLSVGTEAGNRVWYRLFALACLMSAGRRMTELREFWRRELEGREFWARTSGATFAEGTDALFDDLMRRQFSNQIASGEFAYFWRRVFYDVRKIHKLVWTDNFPDSLLRLVQSGRAGDLLAFLKSGTLAGQANWVGVFGQSAGSPLFFLVRELCRLGVITSPEVEPLAFFVAKPVRRAMERIGWLNADASDAMDFHALSAVSMKLHSKIKADRTHGPKLLPFYDIPLLHLGLNFEE